MSFSRSYAGLPPNFFSELNLDKKLNPEQQKYLCELIRYNWRAFEKAARLEIMHQPLHISPRSEESWMDAEHLEEFAKYDERIALPRFNSQGHVKIIKCKQCDYLALTKLNFWTHLEVHIKPQKKLSCELCPFITEHKHHLDFHLMNHNGAKPYKCEKCEYTCVSKSMLNSHLKSHSSIHQYTCDDCEYKTKYIHSLKQHLRKYKHQPAVVKSANGSPNSLMFIDVHGSKRRPKQRPSKVKKYQCNAQVELNKNLMHRIPACLPLKIPSPRPLVQDQLNMRAMNGSNGLVGMKGNGGVSSVDSINHFSETRRDGQVYHFNGISNISEVNQNRKIDTVNAVNGVIPDHDSFMEALTFNRLMSSLPIPDSLDEEDAVRKLAILKTCLDFANSMYAKKNSDETFENSIHFSSTNFPQREDESCTSSNEVSSIVEPSIGSEENYRLDEQIQPLDLSVNEFKSLPTTNSSNCQTRVSRRKAIVVRRISRSELMTVNNH